MRYLVFISILLIKSFSLFGQDTVVVYNNYKYKIGFEFISDKSADLSLTNDFTQVYGGGIQLVKKIKESHYSLLSGLYYQNRALYDGYLFHTITYPLGVRYENKIFYLSAEGYLNYLLKKETYFKYGFIDRKFNTGIILSIGIEKQICKRFDFFMEAHYMSNITKTLINERSDGILTYLENHGLSLGLNYKIF